jgi:hypothetical protein
MASPPQDRLRGRLLLRSLKRITKESSVVAVILGRPTPHPWLGASIELSSGDRCGLLDLISVGKTLSSEGITSEEPPPAFLQVQPAGSFRDEDVMEPRMLSHPGTSLGAVVAGKVVGDQEDVACRIVGFAVGKQRDIVRRVTRGGTSGEFLAIAHAQRTIHPGFLRPATVIEQRLDAMPIRRPARCWRKGAGNYWPEFVGTDGRRPLGWFSVVGDDLRPFGTKSGSELLPQLCVCRQRTPARR